MQVYILHHTHSLYEDNDDIKLIGVYSTYQKATEAQIKLESVVGFKEHLDGFSIEEYDLNVSSWQEGFVTI